MGREVQGCDEVTVLGLYHGLATLWSRDFRLVGTTLGLATRSWEVQYAIQVGFGSNTSIGNPGEKHYQLSIMLTIPT